jgi:RNA polymerase sigma factor (sigma-70 family)
MLPPMRSGAAIAAPNYRGDAKPETWLIAIASNVLADEIGGRKRRAPFGQNLEELAIDPPDDTDIAQLTTDRVAAQLVLEALTPEQQEAIRLVVGDELTSAEAGKQMQKSAVAVRSLVLRGLRKARESIRDLRG